VREGPTGVYVTGLSEHRVRSASDVLALLELGEEAKMFAQTRLVRVRVFCFFSGVVDVVCVLVPRLLDRAVLLSVLRSGCWFLLV
jgi:hypothetical protein